MIQIKCETGETSVLGQLKQYQGSLKKRSNADIDALIASIKEDGLLMPFAVWEDKILDGHARFEALVKLAIEDSSILTQNLPILRINAQTDSEARTFLLQITSQYGRINKKGLRDFVIPIENYKLPAPVVIKTIGVPSAPKAPKAVKTADNDQIVIRVGVRKDMADRLIEVLKSVEGVVIL